jgi:hypothetical protein
LEIHPLRAPDYWVAKNYAGLDLEARPPIIALGLDYIRLTRARVATTTPFIEKRESR